MPEKCNFERMRLNWLPFFNASRRRKNIYIGWNCIYALFLCIDTEVHSMTSIISSACIKVFNFTFISCNHFQSRYIQNRESLSGEGCNRYWKVDIRIRAHSLYLGDGTSASNKAWLAFLYYWSFSWRVQSNKIYTPPFKARIDTHLIPAKLCILACDHVRGGFYSSTEASQWCFFV